MLSISFRDRSTRFQRPSKHVAKSLGPPTAKPLETKRLERLLPDWSNPLGAVYWVTPPDGPLQKRVEVLRGYLIARLIAVAQEHSS